MNNGHGGWLISSCALLNLPAKAHSAGRSTFQAPCRLSSFYLSVFLIFWLPITGVCRFLNLTIANSARCLCAACVRSPCTSVDYTMILGMPILPVPTLSFLALRLAGSNSGIHAHAYTSHSTSRVVLFCYRGVATTNHSIRQWKL